MHASGGLLGAVQADLAMQIHEGHRDTEGWAALPGNTARDLGDRWLRAPGPLGDPHLCPAGRLNLLDDGFQVHAVIISTARYFRNRYPDGIEYQNADMARNEDLSTMGGRLRAARREKGVGQIALAKAAGVSQSLISDIENNEVHETAKIIQIARAAGVNAPWLAEKRGARYPSQEAAEVSPAVWPRESIPDSPGAVACLAREALGFLRLHASTLTASDRRVVASLLSSYVGDTDASERQLDAICEILEGADRGSWSHPHTINEGVTGPGGITSGDEVGEMPHPRKPGAQRK